MLLARGRPQLLFLKCLPVHRFSCVRGGEVEWLTVTIITFERIIRSEVLRAPSKYHFNAPMTNTHGAMRRIVHAYGMAETPSRMPVAMMGIGIASV